MLPPSGIGIGISEMLKVVERHNVTLMMVPPPVVVAMTKAEEAILMRSDLETLEMVMSGGAPLSPAAAEQFHKRYPRVLLAQVIQLR